MKYGTCILAAALAVFAAPAVSHAEMIDFDGPLFGATIDSAVLSGKWAQSPNQCVSEPNNSGEEGGCIYALMTTSHFDPAAKYKNPPQLLVAEVCYAETPEWLDDQGSFKVIKTIDEDTISVKPGTEWIWPDEAVPTYKRCAE